MKFRTSETIDDEWKITIKTQQGGQKVGMGLRIITVEKRHIIGLSMTYHCSHGSTTRAIKNIKELIELGEGIRW